MYMYIIYGFKLGLDFVHCERLSCSSEIGKCVTTAGTYALRDALATCIVLKLQLFDPLYVYIAFAVVDGVNMGSTHVDM